MTVDIFMLALHLLFHFIIVSVAVLVGLWLYYLTEWLMERLTRNPLPERFFNKGRD